MSLIQIVSDLFILQHSDYGDLSYDSDTSQGISERQNVTISKIIQKRQVIIYYMRFSLEKRSRPLSSNKHLVS